MSGIYVHIPFCKTRCSYCDFYSEILLQHRTAFVDSVVKELHLRKNYLPDNNIKTIYFGGGTPSQLDKSEFEQIFKAIFDIYHVDSDAEITLEANPDDLTEEYLQQLSELPFNRLSIGIQSFDDEDLKRLNRRHTGKQAIEAIKNAQSKGFDNISIDLIYGLPFQTLEDWSKQLDVALTEIGVQHISAYGLTYEEGTVLWKQRNEGKIKPTDDDTMIDMYRLLLDKVQAKGFEAYEISNFALLGFRSRHNSSYWKQISYIGIGPSAHSYDGVSRQWNVPAILKYIKSLAEDKEPAEKEILTLNDQYNDFVMVSLRTSDGLDLNKLECLYGSELKRYCLQNIKSFIESEKVILENNVLCLSTAGILVSDHILSELMKI